MGQASTRKAFMKITALRCSMIILVGAGSLASAGPSAAATVNLKAELKASNEVGAGSVALTFNETTKKLTWKGSYANLTAPIGKNASIVVPIFCRLRRAFQLNQKECPSRFSPN